MQKPALLRFSLPPLLGWVAAGVVALGLLAFAESRQNRRTVRNVHVHIQDQAGNYFIREEDVVNLITRNGAEPVTGLAGQRLNLKDLELRIKTNKLVQSCQVSQNLKGDLRVEVQQCRPLARLLLRPAPDSYLSSDGDLLPLSERYTARVLLVESDSPQTLLAADWWKKPAGQSLLALLQFVDRDPFWRAQVAGLHQAADGRLTLHPQVGRQRIEFGSAEGFEEKFERLRLFYTRILPARGWNRYNRVSVAYADQIICE